jgi:prepilin-type N-terminal cleavage/methylation domain-containing protein
MKLMKDNRKRVRQRGFTMIELMVSVTVLTVVVGIVVDGLVKLQQRNTMETTKVDLTQESREFMDQIVSDIHQSGFPSLKVFDPNSVPTPTLNSTYVSQGLVNVTPTSLQFEADVDGSGTVSEVFIQLKPLNGPCPCVVQRGTVSKLSYQGGTLPIYYTEVNNVNNTVIFLGYDNAGNPVALAGAPSNNLAAIEITLNLRSPSPDSNGSYPTITMSTSSKIHNFN